jgi:hypothetical protein
VQYSDLPLGLSSPTGRCGDRKTDGGREVERSDGTQSPGQRGTAGEGRGRVGNWQRTLVTRQRSTGVCWALGSGSRSSAEVMKEGCSGFCLGAWNLREQEALPHGKPCSEEAEDEEGLSPW